MRRFLKGVVAALAIFAAGPVMAQDGPIAKAAYGLAGNVKPVQAQVTSIVGKNLFNPSDKDVLLGNFVSNTTGAPSTSVSYNLTGYIPVAPLTAYATVNQVVAQRRAYYDANKNFISADFVNTGLTFTTPAGAAYMRQTVPVAYWGALQIEQGAAPTAYRPYGSASVMGLQNPYQAQLLRQTHMALTKLGLPTPEATQLIINLSGDSYTQGATRWAQPFTQFMAAKYGDAGGGWCGFGFLVSGNVAPWTTGNQPSFLNGNARPATYPTREYGSIAGIYYTAATADLAAATLSQAGDAVEQDFPASPTISSVDLHFIGTSGGSIRYTFNGGTTWTTLSVSGTTGVTAVTTLSLTGYTAAAAGTLRIEWVSGTATLAGVNLKSTASGVRVNKIAATGSAVSAWAQNSTGAGFTTSSAALSPNLIVYMDGPNSQTAGVSTTQWGTYLTTLINLWRTITPGIDVFVMAPPENQRTTNPVPVAGYALQARNMAATMRFAFTDTQNAFGDPSNPTEYGSAGIVPLFATDLLHPDPPTGGRLLMAEALKAILPFGGQ